MLHPPYWVIMESHLEDLLIFRNLMWIHQKVINQQTRNLVIAQFQILKLALMDYSGHKKLAPKDISKVSCGGVIWSKQSQFWTAESAATVWGSLNLNTWMVLCYPGACQKRPIKLILERGRKDYKRVHNYFFLT